MEFFDKKQDVIDLKLTRLGKMLLSVGEFDPTYYAFSDDGIVYDSRWVSGSTQKEAQWLVEQRIQEETPRIQTLNSKVGAERTIFNTANISAFALQKNIIDLFNIGNTLQDREELKEYASGKLKLDPDFADNEKLLINILGNKRHFTNKAPAWNVLFYNGELASSTRTYQENGLSEPIPQLSASIRDRVYRAPIGWDVFQTEPSLVNIGKLPLGVTSTPSDESYEEELDSLRQDGPGIFEYEEAYNELVESIDFPSGSITIEKGYLLISVEEANVDFNNENFELEVYEITKTDEMQALNKMAFYNKTPRDWELRGTWQGSWLQTDAVENVFNVQVDAEINRALACFKINDERKLKTQNIYTTDVFDCDAEVSIGATTGNPYNLGDVNAEDVC